MNKNNITRHSLTKLILTALFTGLIVVSAQIIIPLAVPFTLQSLGIFLASGILGWKQGMLSVALYIMLGVIGLPVFSGFQGGLGVLFGVTGGYIWGFLPTAFIVGIVCEKVSRKKSVMALAMASGLIVCYLLGTIWYSVYTSTAFISALAVCVAPFLIADIAKIVVVISIIKKLEKITPIKDIIKITNKENNIVL